MAPTARTPNVIICASRQSGKSKACAGLALYRAMVQPGALIILLSPSQRQSGELFRDKIRTFYNALGRPIKPVSETALTMELENGSRIICLPGNEKTVQGYSNVAMLVIDEGSRVGDTLYRSVRPFLAVSAGQLICLSTPLGKRGWFYESWYGLNNGEGPYLNRPSVDCLQIQDQWTRFYAEAKDCPRITPEILEEEKVAMGERWFAQDYCCSFEDMAGAVFSNEDITAAITDEVEPLFPCVR